MSTRDVARASIGFLIMLLRAVGFRDLSIVDDTPMPCSHESDPIVKRTATRTKTSNPHFSQSVPLQTLSPEPEPARPETPNLLASGRYA